MTNQTLAQIVHDLNKIGLPSSVSGYTYNEQRQEFLVGMSPPQQQMVKRKPGRRNQELTDIRDQVRPILREHCPESHWRTDYRKDESGVFSRMENGIILAFRWRTRSKTKQRPKGKRAAGFRRTRNSQ